MQVLPVLGFTAIDPVCVCVCACRVGMRTRSHSVLRARGPAAVEGPLVTTWLQGRAGLQPLLFGSCALCVRNLQRATAMFCRFGGDPRASEL